MQLGCLSVHHEGSRTIKVSADAAPHNTSCRCSAPLIATRTPCAQGLGSHLFCMMTVPQAITGRIFAHFPSVCTGNDTYLHVTRTVAVAQGRRAGCLWMKALQCCLAHALTAGKPSWCVFASELALNCTCYPSAAREQVCISVSASDDSNCAAPLPLGQNGPSRCTHLCV